MTCGSVIEDEQRTLLAAWLNANLLGMLWLRTG